jgi:hypothetical protein
MNRSVSICGQIYRKIGELLKWNMYDLGIPA